MKNVTFEVNSVPSLISIAGCHSFVLENLYASGNEISDSLLSISASVGNIDGISIFDSKGLFDARSIVIRESRCVINQVFAYGNNFTSQGGVINCISSELLGERIVAEYVHSIVNNIH
ncbi:MAG: hypothetical protein NXI00_24425 [Cytophagales bacterium]|nr:hypothetical protein [Cytophagales bacterium]